MYKKTETGAIIRVEDGASIPADPRNQDYAAYLVWVAAGNTALPVDQPSLQEVQGSQIGLLYTAYQAAIAQNITLTTAGGVTKAFQADRAAIDNLQAMLAAFPTTVPAGFYWVASDNTRVPFTLADMKALAAAMGNQGWSAFQRLQDRKAAVLAATTVAQVQAVVW